MLLGELISVWEAEFRSFSQYSVFSGHGVGDRRIVERRSRSAIADYRKHELFHPRFSLNLSARHRTGRGGGVTGERGRMTMMPVLFAVSALGRFWFLGDELLVLLPQLDLQLFERFPIGLLLLVAFQVAAPPVSVLNDDVFC